MRANEEWTFCYAIGCICFDVVWTLTSVKGNINSEKYIEVLENNLWPVIVRHFPSGNNVFQDDPFNRIIHGRKWYKYNNIPISIWLRLKRHLQSIKNRIYSQNQLIKEIARFWQNLAVNYIHRFYYTIPTRLQEVIRVKGHLTKS